MANPIGPPGFGFLGVAQWSREAVWGTYLAPTKRIPFFSFDAKPMVDQVVPALLDGTLANAPRAFGAQSVEVTLDIPLTYSNSDMWMDWIMGTATYGSVGGTTSGGGPYVHTWGNIQTFLNSFAFEFIRGNIPTGKCERIVGLKPIKATIKCNASRNSQDQVAHLQITCIGKQLTTNQTPTVVGTLGPNLDVVLFQHINILTDPAYAVTNAQTLDWQLEIDLKTKERLFLEGSGFISEPQRDGKPLVTLTLTREFQSRAGLDAFINGSRGYIETKFLSGTNYWDFLFYGAMKQTPEAPITNEQWIKQKFVWTNEDDGSGLTLQATSSNFISAIP